MSGPAEFLFRSRNLHVVYHGGSWGYCREGYDSDRGVFHSMSNCEHAKKIARKYARRERVRLVVHDMHGGVVSREDFSRS